MFKKISLLLKLENLKGMIFRFPIAFVLVIGISFLLLLAVNIGYIPDGISEYIFKSVFSFAITFFLSLGVYLACEDSKLSATKKSLFQLFPVMFGFLFYYSFSFDFDSYVNTILFLLCLVGISAFVFFAPFIKNLKKGTDNNIYYQYFYRIAIVFLFGFILGGLLFGLGSLAVLAIDTLFDISWTISGRIYENWAVIAMSFIAPIICLMEIPINNQKLDKAFQVNTFFSFIIKYVLTIAVFVYFLILYVYSAKVLMNFSSWPRQEVTTLVIVFTIVGYITYILTYYFDKIKAIGLFRKLFPIIVIPQLFMLFYAIYLRIAQYDITINRYFVVVFGVWLFVISLYLIFSRKKSLISITAILTLFTIIISIGPWSVFTLPMTRQLARLNSNLIEAGILVDGNIVPLKDYSDIKPELSKQIYDGIDYMCYTVNCEPIKEIFKNELDGKESRWNTISKITEKIKVKSYYSNDGQDSRYIFLSIGYNGLYPIDIAGYDYLVELVSINKKNNLLYTESSDSTYLGMKAQANMDLNQINIVSNDQILESISMGGLLDDLYNKYLEVYGTEVSEYEAKNNFLLSKEELTYDFEGEKYNIRLLVESYNATKDEYGNLETKYINGYALIKVK